MEAKYCMYCGKKLINDATIDHIHPLHLGGKSDFKNCVASCFNCNIKIKANKTLDMCGLKLIKQPYEPSLIQYKMMIFKNSGNLSLFEQMKNNNE